MWAQIVRSRVKPGKEGDVQRFSEERDREFLNLSPGAGPTRIIVLQEENNPGAYLNIIFFESEAAAREYEQSETQHRVREQISEVFEAPHEFIDTNVVYEVSR